MRAFTLPIAATLVAAACLSGPSEPDLGPAEVRAVFVGNSLTAANDLPGMVESIAAAAGRGFEHRAFVNGGYSLEEHWRTGVGERIGQLEPDVVVLQQGPSSVGTNPSHLRRWAETFAPVVRDAGGRPALLMVWPERTRTDAFDAVRESYRAAARAVDGRFIPAGEAWRAVWEAVPDAPLYGPDGFHPSRLGTFVTALAVFEVLFETDVRELPPMVVSDAEAPAYYEAVHSAVEAWSTAGR